jgi:ABC-type enterochelin transport system substrate-binding protein
LKQKNNRSNRTSHSFETSPSALFHWFLLQTELLYDLGLKTVSLGLQVFVHPYHFKSTKKIVGGTKKVHVEKIRLLQPDIIICNKEENTLEIVDELQNLSCFVTNIITIEDNFK